MSSPVQFRCVLLVLFFLWTIRAELEEAPMVLVEAETFVCEHGPSFCWKLDSQFMDQVGSPYMLAHGKGGRPVNAVTTTVTLIPEVHQYRVWVRTKDWVAYWTKGKVDAPGKFQLIVNGVALNTTFGTEGENWHWQDGGVVDIIDPSKPVKLKLHDLTGFDGRCDAILFVPTYLDTLGARPPDDAPAPWRRAILGIPEEPVKVGDNFDFVVVGGGIAGITASLKAARLGLKVALLHDRPIIGGNSSPEVHVGVQGKTSFEPHPFVGSIVEEIRWALAGPNKGMGDPDKACKYQESALKEAGVTLLLGYRVNEVTMIPGGKIIVGVIATNIVNSTRIFVNGHQFLDSTGDAIVGYLAGADFDVSEYHMGFSNIWSFAETNHSVSFPSCPWALNLTDWPFPGRNGQVKDDTHFERFSGWYWESGFSRDIIKDAELVRDNNFRAMYGAWDVVKNVDKSRPNAKIWYTNFQAGKRESRRLLGDVILNTQHLISGKEFRDGLVPLSWDLDVHRPHPYFADGEKYRENSFYEWPFISEVGESAHRLYKRPFWLPYRTLYSRNIRNLFMAGRDISVTHEALGTVRVQATTGMMGEIVGLAAVLCKQYCTDPRGVYESHLDELIAYADIEPKELGTLLASQRMGCCSSQASSSASALINWSESSWRLLAAVVWIPMMPIFFG